MSFFQKEEYRAGARAIWRVFPFWTTISLSRFFSWPCFPGLFLSRYLLNLSRCLDLSSSRLYLPVLSIFEATLPRTRNRGRFLAAVPIHGRQLHVGRNIPSTLAGTFCYSLGFAFAVLWLGLLYRTITEQRGFVPPAILLAATGLCHGYTLLFAVFSSSFFLFTKRHFKNNLNPAQSSRDGFSAHGVLADSAYGVSSLYHAFQHLLDLL